MKTTRRAERSASDLAYLTRFMTGLHDDQARLREIQNAYDNLSLLGQLLCAGTDITGMRADFSELAVELLDQLAAELRKKAVLSLGSDARVAIDILVRNLFERTADIGFLATDDDIRAFAEDAEGDPTSAGDRERRAALAARFDEYVRKYSVYHNIILLAPDGRVLVQLDDENPVHRSADPLVAEALSTEQAYVEVFRPSDLLPRESSPLIYAYRVMSADGSRAVGVLCLCFRFEDECRRIFDGLLTEEDWTVITILDRDGRVIASSDRYQFPVGARLERALGEECRIVRFAGREYLATTRETHGYQGYFGPGWVGHALAPLNHAFEMAAAHELDAVPAEVRAGVLDTSTLFSAALREIPRRATAIQDELNRAVWNGNLWLTRDGQALNGAFAKVLLWEIASTGARTRNVFSESTTNLYETVVSAVLHDCSNQAALAMDIMDRNLYERANDCRWWALSGTFGEVLAAPQGGEGSGRARLAGVLRTINGLYTVYSNLLVFDASARVLAVSNPAHSELVGRTVQGDWVRQALALPDSQSYCVSPFTPSPLYDDRPTYTYAAAIRAPGRSEVVGGIAIVFDAAPQFVAMLQDALPRREDGSIVEGAFALFAERDGRIVASTDSERQPGTRLDLGRQFFELAPGEGCTDIIVLDDRYYAVGSRMSAGYREYKGPTDRYRNDIVALVLVPLSDRVLAPGESAMPCAAAIDRQAKRPAGGGDAVEVATFFIGGNWYGIRSRCVVEAVDRETITAVPGMPDWVRGCVMYQDQPISVFDLSSVLPGRAPVRGPGEIVVIDVPSVHARFGILVDELGDVRDIARSRVEPVPTMMSHGASLTEALVKPTPEFGDKRILVILSAEAILERLAGLSAVPAGDGLRLLGMEAS